MQLAFRKRLNQPLTQHQIACLSALANGIVPPDDTDGGAAAVNAGLRLAEKIQSGTNAALYVEGLELASKAAKEKLGLELSEMNHHTVQAIMHIIRKESPAFFKRLRMDVSALYLSDPKVWQRIGFPGPSIATGGYPDFDQPQEK